MVTVRFMVCTRLCVQSGGSCEMLWLKAELWQWGSVEVRRTTAMCLQEVAFALLASVVSLHSFARNFPCLWEMAPQNSIKCWKHCGATCESFVVSSFSFPGHGRLDVAFTVDVTLALQQAESSYKQRLWCFQHWVAMLVGTCIVNGQAPHAVSCLSNRSENRAA